jgi:2-polyprenyl-6-methoxyphenol hydroxylase-like FAD-dependent oxidoreductase
MTVLIAGAGIGGLTLGLSLHQVGVPFRIFEAVEKLRPLGVGINLQPHAVRELYELGLAEPLDALGLRTEQVAYFSAQGGAIWAEPRGKFAGYDWPQYSIHRGDLQMMLFDTLLARAGADCIQCGAAVGDWSDTSEGVRIALTDRAGGMALAPQSGGVLVAADGINSHARARLFPDEGAANWSGVMMWRGVSVGPKFLGGRTMAMAGRKACKFVCYPIRDIGRDQCLINWIADRALAPDYDWLRQDWNRRGRLQDFLPAFADWTFDWLDIPALIGAAPEVFEYPMVDRDPLARWTHGRMTLLGDAAHAMYPIGSSGASQAILDARVLARELRDRGVGAAALQAYEAARRDSVNTLVLAIRGDGPDRVLDIVADRAPDGFGDIHQVMSRDELSAMARRYKAVAGMDVDELNARGSLLS